jgi:hypothetical protein
MVQTMKRHESWRLEYRANRYMRDLTVEELLARAGDFLTNLSVHSMDGRIAMKPVDLHGDSSGTQRFTHVLEEMTIRGIDHRNSKIIEAMKPPKPKSPKVMRALKTLARRKWPERIIVRYGKRKHMAELLLYGRGRILPATSYKNESLGYAMADDESCVAAYLDPADSHRYMGVRHESSRSVGFDLDVPYLGSLPIQVRANTDFYVYCLAESTDARLFDDFADYDACVVITRPDEFKSRVKNGVSAQLPGWKFIAGPVIYFDPFFCLVHKMVPHFWKHFRFSYQKEHRLVWLPPTPGDYSADKKLDHVYFEVGPLTDCAKLVWL